MENAASVDVAHMILADGGVADCAVGLPHQRWTEVVRRQERFRRSSCASSSVTSTRLKGVQA
jgi:hypothetical protein